MADYNGKRNISIDALKRLENNHYALEKAYQRLVEAIETRDENEIYASTGETLLWVITTEEWHLKHKPSSYKYARSANESGQILLGLKHSYNSMKHNMNFIKIHQIEGGFAFPFEFPLKIPRLTVRWVSAEKVDEGFENQINNYKKYVEGKEVLETFHQALSFLNNQKKKLNKG